MSLRTVQFRFVPQRQGPPRPQSTRKQRRRAARGKPSAHVSNPGPIRKPKSTLTRYVSPVSAYTYTFDTLNTDGIQVIYPWKHADAGLIVKYASRDPSVIAQRGWDGDWRIVTLRVRGQS